MFLGMTADKPVKTAHQLTLSCAERKSTCLLLSWDPRVPCKMDSSYTWILIVGIVVFFAVIVVLLCFTKAAGERLFFSGIEDPELANEIEETPALLALLSEDARISYEQAKGK